MTNNNIEFEATFLSVDHENMRTKLKEVGAIMVHPEFLQIRTVFELPPSKSHKFNWIRVRKEFNQITMAYKNIKEGIMESQEEIELIINDYDKAIQFLEAVGAIKKGVQETKRETWKYQDVEITLDTWPFLDTMVEIEGSDKKSVQRASKLFDFEWSDARFASADFFYAEKFKITIEEMNRLPELKFGMKNPFIK